MIVEKHRNKIFRRFNESRENSDMKTLFKQIVSLYVRGKKFGVISDHLRGVAIVFVDDLLDSAILIKNEGSYISMSFFATSKVIKIKSLSKLIEDEGIDDDDLIIPGWENVDSWEIPSYKKS